MRKTVIKLEGRSERGKGKEKDMG